ncbi:hypothetical protein BpHYR1_011995 [Brachionus plicatilis]|uniref:Uncharacterized protein n=1 Tax=Brachionus plicatilis TaxID=10195 RepID=A0A3M7QUQ9_BRAPC|nr:hypothetical protein BpHYR1_011995 [Brachionus plicatilis]
MKSQLITDLSKNDLSHAIKELNNCLNYQLAKELKPKRKKLPQRNISILDDKMQNKNIEGPIYLKIIKQFYFN